MEYPEKNIPSSVGFWMFSSYYVDYMSELIIIKWLFVFLAFYPLANEVARGYSKATVRPSVRPSVLPSVRHNPCEHSRINILQWILTKLGTYLVLKRIWNHIDFQDHRLKVKVTGSNFYRITSLWTL
jgi:hypothetical protein